MYVYMYTGGWVTCFSSASHREDSTCVMTRGGVSGVRWLSLSPCWWDSAPGICHLMDAASGIAHASALQATLHEQKPYV